MASVHRWKEISSLFNEALTRAPDQRAAFLATACPDEALRAQVASLLECEAPAEQFLDATAAQIAGDIADPGATLVGQRLGAYRVDSLLGAGGMGTVYKATDTRLDRTVAIKILPPSFTDQSVFQQRFEREARAIAGLRHPHICVLHDIGREGGTHFLVMEYLEGETLAARLARGPLPPEDAIRYANEIASALVEMHSQGVIHRDLKPANIMLTKTGTQLLDFGLARFARTARDAAPLAASAAPPPADGGSTFDATSRAGTLSYMAPEQVRGEPVDHRADLFAFGAILYEMVSGVKAFRGHDAAAVAHAVLHDEPPPIPMGTGVDALDAVLRRCLRKVPSERWPDAETMAAQLRQLASTRPLWRTRGALFRVALAAAAVVATFMAWWAVAGRRPEGAAQARARDSETPRLALENVRLLAGDDELELSPSFSPDGRSITYARGHVTRVQAFARSLDGGAPWVLHPNDTTQNQPRWSPDGTQILYISLDGVHVAPVSGGSSRLVVAGVPVDDKRNYIAARAAISAAAWSPDGLRIAVVDNADKSVSIVSLADGSRQYIATSSVELHACDWSPDGHWIACTANNWHGHFAGLGWAVGNYAPSAIMTLPATGGVIREVTDFSSMNQSPVWSADSRRLLFISNRARTFDIYSQAIDGEGGAAGTPQRLTTGLGAWSLAFSSDRKTLAYTVATPRANLWSLPIPEAGVVSVAAAQPLTRGNQMIEAMRVSRSGKWVVYDSNLAGTFDIYRVPVGGGPPERLTSEPGEEFLADLASDERSLAYQSWLTTSRDIFVKTIGPEPPVQITSNPAQEGMPAWSPDGRSIAFLDFTEDRGVFRGLLLISRDATGKWGAPRSLRPGAFKASWSPDGRFLAYSRATAIEIVSPETGEVRQVYAGRPNTADPRAGEVIVSDDSRTLYFKNHNPLGQAEIWSVPVSGGTPRLRVSFGDRLSTRPDMGAGAGRFFFTIDERRSNIWLADVREQ
jgi:eukaryotic-like serine/threonine-protein kinase